MKRRVLLFLMICVLAGGCHPDDELQSDPDKREFSETEMDMMSVKGRLRIKLSQELANSLEISVDSVGIRTRVSGMDHVLTALGASSMRRTFPPAGRFEARTRAAGLHLWYDIVFDEDKPVSRASADFLQFPGVEIVEPIRKTVQLTLPFNDPELDKQWHYYNDGSLSGSIAGADINLFEAWKTETGKKEVIVSVVDGGIDFEHEDLAANMWMNEAEVNGVRNKDDDDNGYKDDVYGFNFVDQVGTIKPGKHGTHVAGTVAAVNNNGKGVCGVAGGDGSGNGVRLMSCQIFGTDASGKDISADGAPAIKYGADNGAVISQNSWGYEKGGSALPASLKAAIDYFVTYAGVDEHGNQEGPMKGGIVIFAAGNDNLPLAYPACYEKVVAVAALTSDYRKADFSNYGEWVDISAPGVRIYSTTPGNTYGYLQGTSMACPHVSGVAALVVSKFGGQGYTPEKLKERLFNTAKDIYAYNRGYQSKLGIGLIDAAAALAVTSTVPPQKVTKLWGTVSSNIASLQWLVPADPDDVKAAGFSLYYTQEDISSLNPDNLPSHVGVRGFATGDLNVGDTMTAVLPGLEFETNYNVFVDAYDASGNRSALSPRFSFQTGSNGVPVITPVNGNSITLRGFETRSLAFIISDPDGHDMTWALENPSEAITGILSDKTITLTINATKLAPGTYQGRLNVSDVYGASTDLSFTYVVEPNHAPHVILQPEDVVFSRVGEQIALTLADYFVDEDGEPLSYSTVVSDSRVAHLSPNRGNLYITALAVGATDVTLTAKDALGESASVAFRISVGGGGDQEVSLYPNPVKDKLNILTKEGESVEIILYNTAGVKVLDGRYVVPAQVDLSRLPGGSYVVVVKYNGKEYKNNIVKL